MTAPDALPTPQALRSCNGRLALLWVLGRRQRFRAKGPSMWPTLHDGQSFLLDPRGYSKSEPQCGDVVMVRHPERPNLLTVKRLGLVLTDQVFVVGDNRAQSTDSRSYGMLSKQAILGRVECTFP